MRTTKPCPKCREALPIDAEACECGWSKAAKPISLGPQPKPHIDCGYAPCADPARIRVRTKRGWLNVCLGHYEHHYRSVESIRERYEA